MKHLSRLGFRTCILLVLSCHACQSDFRRSLRSERREFYFSNSPYPVSELRLIWTPDLQPFVEKSVIWKVQSNHAKPPGSLRFRIFETPNRFRVVQNLPKSLPPDGVFILQAGDHEHWPLAYAFVQPSSEVRRAWAKQIGHVANAGSIKSEFFRIDR